MQYPLPKTLTPFIWRFLKPYTFPVIAFIVLAALAGFWGPFNSILIKQIINLLPEVVNGDTGPLFWPAALIVLNFIVFDNFTWRGVDYLNYKYEAVLKNNIIRETMDQVLSESHQFFQDNLSGRIANQITTLADNIELILHRISLDFIRGASLLIVSFITAYIVNPMFFYTLFLWCIVFSVFSIAMSKRLVNLADVHAAEESLLSGQLVDCISNHSNIRIFAKKTHEISRMNQFFQMLQKAFQSKQGFLVFLHSGQGGLIAMMMGGIAYFLVHFYGTGKVSIGDFALMFGLSMELGHMMWYTMSRVDEFNQAIGKCKQSLNALMIMREIHDKEDAKELSVQKGEIAFDKVKFHYKGTKALFQNKSVVIEAGQKVGLVGYSGSGKSTFVNLILRLYDVSDGAILIDGQDIRDLTQESLRAHIGMIPQDPSLFHRSLMDNIRYGKTEASDTEVVAAAKKAHAHEFIATLAEGYDALVGERGVKLSGGQRQRIAIARAILKNAPILMLDEATSQLDSVTEHYIQESLWELMQAKTTIVIAHRLSTLLHMDRILVFDKGEIVEDGTHAALLAKNGLYKRLWDAQVGGFLPDNQSEEN
jgi:ATP-binding cassette, subfamily B, bacterial